MKGTDFYFIVIAVIAVLFMGCQLDNSINGNGNITSTERTAAGFTGITLEGAGNINVHFSENFKVVVTTDSNIQDIVTLEAKNNILYVDEKRWYGINPTKLIIDVYLPELENITLKGAGNIKIDAGNASTLSLILSGAGNIEAKNYEVKNVNAILSGTGDIERWVTGNLSGNISGVGNIYYKGNPAKKVKITGVGNIKSL